jgi:phosphatidate cytidylyltransferase
LLVLIVSKKNIDLGEVSLTVFGVLYIPFLLFHIYYLDKTDYIWLVFIIAFGTDTFAYVVGNLFGRHKLSPNLSPKKTIEGSIGGILGSMFLTIIYSIYIGNNISWHLILLSIVVSVMSQLGDLAASKIKRMAGIKDYGFIMPGHGGVLDRFDSIIICAPLVYYYVYYFIN